MSRTPNSGSAARDVVEVAEEPLSDPALRSDQIATGSRLKRALKFLLPFAVSGGLLVWLISGQLTGPEVDRAKLLDLVVGSLVIWVPVFIAYGAFSLLLEAYSILRLMPDGNHSLTLWTAARIKAASYLLYIVSYAVGAGTLSFLLPRRASISLAHAAGVVALIAGFDLATLALVTGVSALLLQSGAAGIPQEWIERILGLGGLLAACIVLGVALLRARRSLGPLDRLRELSLFRAARETPPRRLVELALVRFAFVCGFIASMCSVIYAFRIEVPVPDAIVNVALVSAVSSLPIAFAGLGTGQAAFVYLLKDWADPGTLIACSLTMSVGMIALRGLIGFIFSREFALEALQAARQESQEGN
ncbi:MAG: flippase-like domain-containing protein [bacterium]|nr:flippase-like domain-containing protein [bacterium]